MMKNMLILMLFVAMMTGHSLTTAAQKPSENTATEIGKLLDKWHRDAAAGNHQEYIGAMTSDGLFIGTDACEHWSTSEFSTWCKPHFDKGKTWDFRVIKREIHVANDEKTAWFDELLNTKMGLCRGSGVVVKQKNQWKVAQYILSATVPNELMKEVTRIKSAADSALIYQTIFTRFHMKGTMIICDGDSRKVFGYNQSKWDSGYLPASTFKIPNSLIGLETGVIDSGYIFKWNGEKRRLPQWNADLDLTQAFRVSCVPCFQEVARKIGPERMNEYLQKLHYPGMRVSPANIDLFWLEGVSRITPRQQLGFIMNLYDEKLPLQVKVMKAVKGMMLTEKTKDYTLSGKTGWAVRNGNNYGWFAGWLETKGKTYFLATLVEPDDQQKTDDFAAARKTVTMEVFRMLGMIPSE